MLLQQEHLSLCWESGLPACFASIAGYTAFESDLHHTEIGNVTANNQVAGVMAGSAAYIKIVLESIIALDANLILTLKMGYRGHSW